MRIAVTSPHRPVLVAEVIRNLVTRGDGVYIDGTLGAGGHAEAILRCLTENGRVVGIDCDEEAISLAMTRLESFGRRSLFLKGSYENLQEACGLAGAQTVDGILLDLGVSSMQIDRAERGFSFSKEGPLDMRMDPGERTTAAEILAKSHHREIERILREYGEEPFARRIAAAIVERGGKIKTTRELADLVARVVPRKGGRIHPATRVFQALRIAVNRELVRLNFFLEKAPAFLKTGGRLAILSYHSLEDRLVKTSFLRREREGVLKRITRKPIRPSEEEIRDNNRARSARLRVAEKTS